MGLCAEERTKGFETKAKFKDKKAPAERQRSEIGKKPAMTICLDHLHKNCWGPAKSSFSTGTIALFGAVDEWFKSHAWKACVG
jgi:hypothetical protein